MEGRLIIIGVDVNGELIRRDVRDGQSGIDLYADIQVIDINTCHPVPNLYLDWWHANASGVYSGVVANGNGDSSDATNIVHPPFLPPSHFPIPELT